MSSATVAGQRINVDPNGSINIFYFLYGFSMNSIQTNFYGLKENPMTGEAVDDLRVQLLVSFFILFLTHFFNVNLRKSERKQKKWKLFDLNIITHTKNGHGKQNKRRQYWAQVAYITFLKTIYKWMSFILFGCFGCSATSMWYVHMPYRMLRQSWPNEDLLMPK